MSVHIIKLVVGVEDMQHFAQVQERCAVPYQGGMAIPVRTRNKPRQAEEILNEGGSLYRVIKNRIQCHQKIVGFETVEDDQRGTMCLIMVSPEIIRTVSTAKRPFQGWRYLKPSDVPRDVGVYDVEDQSDDIPADMRGALEEAGLV